MAITTSDGIHKYEVVEVNEDKGTYTVREWKEGDVIKARKNFHLFVEKVPPVFEKTFTYGTDGAVLKGLQLQLLILCRFEKRFYEGT